jgi:hypothetical protein
MRSVKNHFVHGVDLAVEREPWRVWETPLEDGNEAGGEVLRTQTMTHIRVCKPAWGCAAVDSAPPIGH